MAYGLFGIGLRPEVRLAMKTATETVNEVLGRRLSAVEAVRTALDEVERRDEGLGAFVSIDRDGALRDAAHVDGLVAKGGERLPLAGLAVALKDNMSTKRGTTSCGSRMLADYRAPYDCHVAERLQAAGAIIIGKTNMDEFAMGSSTESSAFKVTRNPWDSARVPGGSSGGSAVAVATGMVPAALGSDTGGSIRQPASFTGVVGVKPTYGRVSRYGLVAYGSSLDQIGPFARTAEDAALLLSVISGHDERDSTSVDHPVDDLLGQLERPIEGTRIGIPQEYFGEGLDSEVRSAVNDAIGLLEEKGARIVEIELEHMKYGIACYYIIATAEASSNLARYDGVHYGHRTAKPEDVIDLYSASREEGFGSEVKRRIMLGTYVLSSGYYDAYYLRALKVRTLLRRDFTRAFEEVDVIAGPVAPSTAFGIGEKLNDPLAMYLADVYTISVNLAGIPAVSIPCGFDGKGLPIGLQLMGPAFSEGRLLGLAHQYQLLTDFHNRTPTCVQ